MAQFQGIPSGVSQGTNSPEHSGDDPWDLVLYQEDEESSEPSGDDPVQAAMTQFQAAAKGDGASRNPSSIPG